MGKEMRINTLLTLTCQSKLGQGSEKETLVKSAISLHLTKSKIYHLHQKAMLGKKHLPRRVLETRPSKKVGLLRLTLTQYFLSEGRLRWFGLNNCLQLKRWFENRS